MTLRGDRIAYDRALVRRWGLNGRGIVRKSIVDVGDDLAAGRLVELLGDYPPATIPLQIVLPPGRAQPRRVGALVDRLAEAVRARVRSEPVRAPPFFGKTGLSFRDLLMVAQRCTPI